MSKIIVNLLDELVEDLESLKSEYVFDEATRRLELKHRIGEMIIESEYYKKNEIGNTDKLALIGDRINMHKSDLYYCISFFKKFPKLSIVMETLKPDKKTLNWTDVKYFLDGGEINKEKAKEDRCKKCKLHCI